MGRRIHRKTLNKIIHEGIGDKDTRLIAYPHGMISLWIRDQGILQLCRQGRFQRQQIKGIWDTMQKIPGDNPVLRFILATKYLLH